MSEDSTITTGESRAVNILQVKSVHGATLELLAMICNVCIRPYVVVGLKAQHLVRGGGGGVASIFIPRFSEVRPHR